ncbi:hypothetical protein DFH09DRAFT_1339803 [Mycena vulgaris]|nr:hypothetical protein DFH09DRAFT_1339803 [Mycena vulgaris]
MSLADLYLIQKLNLRPANNDIPSTVMLHDLENALSAVVASMFWTLGHIPPMHGTYNSSEDAASGNGKIQIGEAATPPILLQGTATVTEIFTQGRLDVLNIIAIGADLASSIAFLLISRPVSIFHSTAKITTDLPIDGTGILPAIWMYRSHPELETRIYVRQGWCGLDSVEKACGGEDRWIRNRTIDCKSGNTWAEGF